MNGEGGTYLSVYVSRALIILGLLYALYRLVKHRRAFYQVRRGFRRAWLFKEEILFLAIFGFTLACSPVAFVLDRVFEAIILISVLILIATIKGLRVWRLNRILSGKGYERMDCGQAYFLSKHFGKQMMKIPDAESLMGVPGYRSRGFCSVLKALLVEKHRDKSEPMNDL